MSKRQLWLTVYEENDDVWPPREGDHSVTLDWSNPFQSLPALKPGRTSPIFPVTDTFALPNSESFSIYFYCFDPAFPVLGRILAAGSDDLINHLCYSIGLASVIVITDDSATNVELLKVAGGTPRDLEVWRISAGKISTVETTLTRASYLQTFR